MNCRLQSILLAYSNMFVSENGYSVQNYIGGNLFRLDDEKWALYTRVRLNKSLLKLCILKNIHDCLKVSFSSKDTFIDQK